MDNEPMEYRQPDPPSQDEPLHTIREWEKIKDVKILDPDGFNRNDPNLMSRTFTEKEFDDGMMLSTIEMKAPPTPNGVISKNPIIAHPTAEKEPVMSSNGVVSDELRRFIIQEIAHMVADGMKAIPSEGCDNHEHGKCKGHEK